MDCSNNNVKLIAMYLPQYHPIPENDAWWGKGFTEWTNVRKAEPRFPGHYQPHVPGQLGYYDLRDASARQAQAELAREYGIHGFCYYHYWFNGKRLLETPFNQVLKSGEPDFPFCLCWANENWTRRWDGRDQDMLMEQHYSDQDSLDFINDLIPAFSDKRYIRVNAKPLLLVYRTSLLPDPKKTANIWREAMVRAGIGEIYLVRVEHGLDGSEPHPGDIGFDAAMEFAPNWKNCGNRVVDLEQIGQPQHPVDENLLVFNYDECMANMLGRPKPAYKRFRGVFPAWDNSARKQDSLLFVNSTPEKYEHWLNATVHYTRNNFDHGEQLVFVNAWNEWGEGCHLEPDQRYGLGYLEATRQVLLSVMDYRPLVSEGRRFIAADNAEGSLWLERVSALLAAKEESLVDKYRDPRHPLLKELELKDLQLVAKDKELEDKDRVLRALYASLTWRVTAPLRRLLDKVLPKKQ